MSKIQELQRAQIPRKAAHDDQKKRLCRQGEHVSEDLTFCQLRLSSSDEERVFYKWTAKWSHHFEDKLNLLQDAHSDTHRQDWCFLESQGFWHPCVPSFIVSQPATRIAYYVPPTTALHSGTIDRENSLSLRNNRLKVKTSGKLRIVLEESREYTSS